MKRFGLLIVLVALLGCSSQAQVEWKSIEDAAQVEVKNNKKMFFVDFSTSWCGWCKKMDKETFSDPVVAAILNKYYVPVHFDAEGKSQFTWNGTKYANNGVSPNGRPSTHSFTQAILGKRIGYPSFAIFGTDRNLVQILQGYQNAYDFQIVLWYLCSGDKERYDFETYKSVFDAKIKPGMMKKLGLAK